MFLLLTGCLRADSCL
jgi:hypothetical protein